MRAVAGESRLIVGPPGQKGRTFEHFGPRIKQVFNLTVAKAERMMAKNNKIKQLVSLMFMGNRRTTVAHLNSDLIPPVGGHTS